VICTVATRAEGIDQLIEAIEQHRGWMQDHGEWDARRQRRAAAEIEAIALAQLHGKLGDLLRGSALRGLAKRVVVGELDVYRAADELIGELNP
jgi:LAO/AO transport system kinase